VCTGAKLIESLKGRRCVELKTGADFPQRNLTKFIIIIGMMLMRCFVFRGLKHLMRKRINNGIYACWNLRDEHKITQQRGCRRFITKIMHAREKFLRGLVAPGGAYLI
jgi:hypothetical protein